MALPLHFPNDCTIGREARSSQHFLSTDFPPGSVCVCVCVHVLSSVKVVAFLMGCVVYRGGLGNNSVTKGKSRRKTRTPPCPSMGQTHSTHTRTH